VQGTLAGEKIRRSLDLTSLEAGERLILEWQQRGAITAELVTVEDAVSKFLRDAEARNVKPGTLKNARIVLDDLKAFATKRGTANLAHLDLEALRELRESWNFAPITQAKKLERLRHFFAFCVGSGWIAKNPAAEVKPPKLNQSPTLPFTDEEFNKIVSACDRIPDNYGQVGTPAAAISGKRMRALVLLLRYSGLRISDAVTMKRTKLADGKVFLYQQKTGTPVYVPVPDYVVSALEECPNRHPDYFFWTGESVNATVTGKWRDRFSRLLKLAGVSGHLHMLRDTFAVRLLEKGVPLETVSILLGHSSTRVTEKHYAPWVASRQLIAEDAVRKTWEQPKALPANVRRGRFGKN
jgi:site-specific recombinase XerD